MDYHKIYVVIYFIGTGRAVCLDRNYNFITEDVSIWGEICLGDIIDTDQEFFAGNNLPDWCMGLRPTITFWTNYYE